MKYLTTRFVIATDDEQNRQTARELIAAFAGECGYETFLDTEEGVDGYVQQDFFDAEALDAIMQEFPMQDVAISYTTETVEDQDWNETWEKEEGFAPIIIKDRLVIYDAFHNDESEARSIVGEDGITIAVEARNAFGTGTHETTRMLVSELMEMPLQGKRVLDCGCGTGILGITALKCGADEVAAYDIDEWSVENTRHNAQLNGVGEQIAVFEGDASVLSNITGTFDVVLANINRNILLNDMPAFCDKMKPDAQLLLSGFYAEDVPLLVDKANTLGLHLHRHLSDADWHCLIFVR